MTGFFTYYVFVLLDLLPDKFLLISGWLFIGGGAIVFWLGLIKDHFQEGKKMVFWGALSILGGAIAVFMPNYPVLAAILIFIVIFRILWLLFGLGWATLMSV